MKEYIKPLIEDEELEIDDVIAVSNMGDGIGAQSEDADSLWG